MVRQAISEVAARHLEAWLDQLMKGELRLGELPLPVEAFYHAGWASAISVAQEQAVEHEHELDRAYLAAYSPKDRAEVYQRRLDQHFAEQSARFFAEPEHDAPAANERRAA